MMYSKQLEEMKMDHKRRGLSKQTSDELA